MEESEIRSLESNNSPVELQARNVESVVRADVPARSSSVDIVPQECGSPGASTSGASSHQSYVWAIGRIRPAFPSLSVRKEYEQAVIPLRSRLPDYVLPYAVLTQGQNLYIAREMCWILQIDGAPVGTVINPDPFAAEVGSVDAYLVTPRSYVELNDIILTLDPGTAGQARFDVIIGPRGPLAPPEMCNGLQLPIVLCNQIYSFTYDEFTDAMSKQTGVDITVVKSMFSQMLQVTDNAGETDEHRAINYITIRYPEVYRMAARMLEDPNSVYSLTRVSAKPSSVQGVRRVVDVVFQYEERATGEIINWFCKIDVTGAFPFLVRPLSKYYPQP